MHLTQKTANRILIVGMLSNDPYERDEDVEDEDDQEERGYDRYDLDRDLENEGEWI